MEILYPSDLSDNEYKIIESDIPKAKRCGRPRTVNVRSVINGIFYLLKTGCQWRMLPKEFPPWNTVYDHFRRFNQRGVWQQALDALNQQSRRRQGKLRHPAYTIIDSQSVKTQYASDQRGVDAGKKSRAVNAILSPTRWGTYSASSCMRPIITIPPKGSACVCKLSINIPPSAPSPPIKAIQAPPWLLSKTGSTDAST